MKTVRVGAKAIPFVVTHDGRTIRYPDLAIKVNDTVKQVLNAVSAKLTTEGLTALNAEAAGDAKPSPETVAKSWLSKNGLA